MFLGRVRESLRYIMLQKQTLKRYLPFFTLYFLLWVFFFEFIFPSNKVLPQPSIVLQSFAPLWEFYHLPQNFLITFCAVYFPLIIGFYAVKLIANLLFQEKNLLKDFLLSLKLFSEFIPGIVMALFLIMWFPNSIAIEFILSFLIVFFLLLKKVIQLSSNLYQPYLDSIKSFGFNMPLINREVAWKSILPGLKNYILEIHIYLWTILIAFEIIKGNSGLGSIFKNVLAFKDLSSLFAALIIIGVAIFLTVHLLKFFLKKIIHWSEIEF
jgi:ABC-type nitrate/sulfonate/bicarbonate transport system permease component